MTEQERKHFDKMYSRMLETNSNKKIKNKAVLRLLELISYLFSVCKYEVQHREGDTLYRVVFDISTNDNLAESFILKHSIGYGHDNTSVSVEIVDNGAQPSWVRSVPRGYRRAIIFTGNRTRRNLLANVKRIFDSIPDQVRCELYLSGFKINYELTD